MSKYTDMLATEAPMKSKYREMLTHEESPQYQAVTPEQYGIQPGQTAGTGTLAVASFADDPKVQIGYFASKRFPDIPIEEAIGRYKILGGQIAYQGDDGQWYAETPMDWKPKSMIDRVAFHLSKGLPIGAETATGIATAPMLIAGPGGAAASISATGAAAGLGEALRQFIGQKLLGDPFSKGDVALEAGMAATGQGLAKIGTKVAQRNAARDIKRLQPQKVSRLQQEAADEGIQLTPAELTNLSSLKAQQQAVQSMPYSSDIMQEFLEERATKQIPSAVYRKLEAISPVDSGEMAGEMARGAAKSAMESVTKQRAAQASPIYRRAFANKAEVDISDVMKSLADEQTKSKGIMKNALSKVQEILSFPAEGKRYMETDLETLHYAKLELDRMIETARETGIGNVTKAKLVQVKNGLLAAMDEASPDYKAARAIYADLSPGVSKVREGVVGIISDLKDTQLQKAASKIFNPEASGPRSVIQARELIGKADPKAWNAIRRAWLQENFEKAGREYATGGGARLQGGKFRAAVFGDAKRKSMMKEMLGAKEFTSFEKLMNVLEATTRAVDTNSDTAWKLAVQKELKRKGEGFVPTSIEPHMILNRAADWWRQVRLGNYSEKLATVLTSPDAMTKLKDLYQVSPRDARAFVIAAHGIGIIGPQIALSE